MQLRVRHTTGYRYAEGAVASFNEARMTPMTTADQILLRSRIEVTPTPWTTEYRDYWGSVVTAFEVHEPHDELLVVATSTVQTSGAAVGRATGPVGGLGRCARPACRVPDRLGLGRAASRPVGRARTDARGQAATPSAYAHAVCDFINDRLSYVEGATEVTSTGADAWEARSGVCQDFAHLALGVLRSAGIPARYVSGYLHPTAGSGDRRGSRRRVARVDRVVGRRVDRVRPDQRPGRRRAPRRRRPRTRLRRRPAAAWHLLHPRRLRTCS